MDDQLRDWGSRALAAAYQSLEGAYGRYLGRFGITPDRAHNLDLEYALAQTTVANSPRDYLWDLRHVPSKQPHNQSMPPAQVTIHNSGVIGALQTGAGAKADFQQQWINGDASELKAALLSLREELQKAKNVEPEIRAELIADIDLIGAELQRDSPSKPKLLRWLGGIGAAVGMIAEAQPAYEAVKSLARGLGLLP